MAIKNNAPPPTRRTKSCSNLKPAVRTVLLSIYSDAQKSARGDAVPQNWAKDQITRNHVKSLVRNGWLAPVYEGGPIYVLRAIPTEDAEQ